MHRPARSAVLGLLAAFPVHAEDAPSPTAEVRAEVIAGLDRLLEEIYVIPETAERLRAMLHERLEAGAYDGLKTREAFAAALTDDLQELSRDRHLRVLPTEHMGPGRRGPGGPGGPGPGGPVRIRRGPGGGGGGPGGDGPGRIVRGGPGGGPAGGPGDGSDGGVFDGIQGIPEARMLDDHVGYVDIRMFVPRERQEQDAVDAMASVADADAVIFDLRGCMGGAPDMVHLITSYLYPPAPMHLLTYYHAAGEPDNAYTLAEVPGKRMPDAEVYILTSPRTASGGEEFTYNLKHHGRATVVGETTAGAGHGGGIHPVAAGFHAFIPNFRPVHPVTGKGWEDEGVHPDVECASRDALRAAHRMALEAVVARGDGDADALRAAIAGLVEPPERNAPEGEELTAYAGRYGHRTITVEDGALWLQRDGGPKLEMELGGEEGEFTLKLVPIARIRFDKLAGGAWQELHVLGHTGTWEMTTRD